MDNDKDTYAFSDSSLRELGQAIREGVREGIRDSGLDDLIVNMRTVAEKASEMVKILDLRKQARELSSSGMHQEAAAIYTSLAELDQKRKDCYLQQAQQALGYLK